MVFDDVLVVLVMLLSGFRCFVLLCDRDVDVDFDFSAVSVFFSSLFRFRISFSFSFFSFSSFLSLIMFIDCSDVNTRANWVGIPTRR